jgi:hypothetical protein
MANTLTYVIPQLLAQGLQALRQQSIMARLVNRGYEVMAGEKGSTIQIPIPSAVAVAAVSPAATPPATADVAPTYANITLSNWNEAAFYLTDKDIMDAMAGVIPMQASEAVKALANQIDQDIMALYVNVYGYSGTAGATPFAADTAAYLGARKVLAQQAAPLDPRFVVLDPAAEANALGLRAFQDASFGGGNSGIVNGQIGQKMGALWVMDQNIPTHTAGTWSAGTASGTAGTKAVTINTGTGSILVGDILLFAGDTQSYVCTGATGTAPTTAITVEPALKTSPSTANITFIGSHTVNLVFHRDAFALAMRPLSDSASAGLGNFQSMVDPVSGLALRLEVSREHKRTRFSYDALYGVGCPRPELAARILG